MAHYRACRWMRWNNQRHLQSLYLSRAYHLLLAEHHTAQSPHIRLQASTYAHPPFHRSWQLSQLPPPAACGHVSGSNTHQSQQHNTQSAQWEHFLLARSTGQRAASTRRGHMFISFDSPLLRNLPSLHQWCNWAFLSLCLWRVCQYDILTLYQHNSESCHAVPWITFHRCLWPDWSNTSWAYWSSMHCTLGTHLSAVAAFTQQGPAKLKRQAEYHRNGTFCDRVFRNKIILPLHMTIYAHNKTNTCYLFIV